MTPDHRLFRYQGRSMWPCFQEGDLLELREVDFKDIRIGDCIAYRTVQGQRAVHRVTGKTGQLFTRGDAMPTPDQDPVASHKVLGRVVYRHRFGRKTSVSGGHYGRLAALFYRYAGRIDPHRASRGGQLARVIQKVFAAGFKLLRFKGEVKKLVRKGEGDILIWRLGDKVIGRRVDSSPGWTVAWPWTLLTWRREEPD